MKKVLLTTTALVMTAGVAAAEVTFSGTAGIAFVDDNGAQAAAAAGAEHYTKLATAYAAAQDAWNKASAAVNAATTASAREDAVEALQKASKAQAKAWAAMNAAEDRHAIYMNNVDGSVVSAPADIATANGNTDEDYDDGGYAKAVADARADGDGMRAVSYFDLDIKVATETQTGVSMAASFDIGSGEKVDYDDDDAVELQGADVTDADVAVTYMGWTTTVDSDGIDNLFDDDQQHDISIAGSVAGLSIAVAAGLQEDTSSYSLGYTMGDLTLGLTGTNDDDAGGSASGISLGYTMGALSLSASMVDESDDGEDDASIGLSYAMDAITVSYTTIRPGSNSNYGDEWDMSIAYSAGAMSASFAVDETDATTMIGEYDLGGATAFVAMHDKDGEADDLTTVGINFSF